MGIQSKSLDFGKEGMVFVEMSPSGLHGQYTSWNEYDYKSDSDSDGGGTRDEISNHWMTPINILQPGFTGIDNTDAPHKYPLHSGVTLTTSSHAIFVGWQVKRSTVSGSDNYTRRYYRRTMYRVIN